MTKAKKVISLVLTLVILIYSILGIFDTHKSYATLGIRERTSDLSGLTNEKYPGFLAAIEELKAAHPNWTFTILYTGLDWNEVLENETIKKHGKNLTSNTSNGWLCSECKSPYEPGWYCPSQAAVSYYLDARNWINEDYIFAFQALTYDKNLQSIEGVQKILQGTFMDVSTISYTDTEGNKQEINKSYAQIIMEAAEETGVNPYHLASRIRQEQGVSGKSGLINGTFTYTDSDTGEKYDYTGYYNYFNISATGSTTARIIINGLKYASSDRRNPKWTTPELSIKGGAKFIANEYISNYQDCMYLQKYCIDTESSSLYNHQYMANVSAAYSEGNSMKKGYEAVEKLNDPHNFIIPVYENMPQEACKRPTNDMTTVVQNVKSTASTLRIRAGKSTGYSILASVPTGTVLLRIETANNASNDGYYWDKVVYNTGSEIIIGYVARDYIEQIDDVITTDETDETRTDVNLRNGPGTVSTTVLKTLSKDIKVNIIDKIDYIINGHIWYRVKLEDGTQGYIASTYLKNYKTPVEQGYKIKEANVIITPTTALSDIEGATTTSEIWGTGAKVTINNVEYTLIMLGDANEDGVIDSADLLKIVKHLKDISIISPQLISSADVNEDGEVDSADLLKIVKYLKGITSITI